MNCISTKALFDCTVPYLTAFFASEDAPWRLLPKIRALAETLAQTGIPGFRALAPGIWAGVGVTVAETATLTAPCIIGAGTEIRPNAYIRGGVITGEACVIGNATELKNCILLDHVQVPHYNYVGDSILGNRAHMGAGSICSNLKSGGSAVTVHAPEGDIPTGLRKFGALLGDGADIGCGCVLNPGTVIGKNTSVYPLTAVRGVIPSGQIVKAMNAIVPRRDRA